MRLFLERIGAAVLACSAVAAATVVAAQEPVTVQTLDRNYVVVSGFLSPIGLGLVLQLPAGADPAVGGARLYLCFLEELPERPTRTTLYCKPIE
jgi:hypothetical protein